MANKPPDPSLWQYTLWSRNVARPWEGWTCEAMHRVGRLADIVKYHYKDGITDLEWLILPPGENPYTA